MIVAGRVVIHVRLGRAGLEQIGDGRARDLEADRIELDALRLDGGADGCHLAVQRRFGVATIGAAEMARGGIAEGIVGGLVVVVHAGADVVIAVGQEHHGLHPFLVGVGLALGIGRGRREHPPAPKQARWDHRVALGDECVDGGIDRAFGVGQSGDRPWRAIIVGPFRGARDACIVVFGRTALLLDIVAAAAAAILVFDIIVGGVVLVVGLVRREIRRPFRGR